MARATGKRVTIQLDDKVLNWVDGKAEEKMTTRTAIILQAIVEMMEMDKIITELGGKPAITAMLMQRALKKGEDNNDK